jgi:hypothetical protein
MGPVERFLERPERHIPLDEHLMVTCPKCGHRELATERRFFGILGPRAVKAVIVTMILGMIVVALYDLMRR